MEQSLLIILAMCVFMVLYGVLRIMLLLIRNSRKERLFLGEGELNIILTRHRFKPTSPETSTRNRSRPDEPDRPHIPLPYPPVVIPGRPVRTVEPTLSPPPAADGGETGEADEGKEAEGDGQAVEGEQEEGRQDRPDCGADQIEGIDSAPDGGRR